MAKKAADVNIDQDELMTYLSKNLESEFGSGVLMDGKFLADEDVQVISVSPGIDIGIGGGIPEGSWFVLSGPPKVGKTTTALHFAANAQMEENGGRDIFYIDIEGRLRKRNLLGIPNLNLDKIRVIRSTPNKILSGEDMLSITHQILSTIDKCVVIIDSFSAIANQKELDDFSSEQRGAQNKTIAAFIRSLANTVPVKKSIVIGITHMIANTSGWGASTVEKTSNQLKYQCDVKLLAKKIEFISEEGKKPHGQKIQWQVVNSALSPPGAEVTSFIRYGKGIDEISEMISIGIDLGLVKKSGAWLTCSFMEKHVDNFDEKEYRTQGQAKLYELFISNPNLSKILYQEILSIME